MINGVQYWTFSLTVALNGPARQRWGRRVLTGPERGRRQHSAQGPSWTNRSDNCGDRCLIGAIDKAASDSGALAVSSSPVASVCEGAGDPLGEGFIRALIFKQAALFLTSTRSGCADI